MILAHRKETDQFFPAPSLVQKRPLTAKCLKFLEVRKLPRNQSKLWHIFCFYKSAAKTAASTFFESNERQWSNVGPTFRRSITKNRSSDLSELTPIETTREV